MAKFVPDIKTQRWVILSAQRTQRPKNTGQEERKDGSKEASHVCPFCTGNEHLTPPEVWRIGGEGEWNRPGWKVRVVPNKFPITDIHEVIIHSPDCDHDIDSLPKEQVELVLHTYRARYKIHQKDGQVMIFCNHGKLAGASLRHPHSQLVVVPQQINLDTLEREPLNNLVQENTNFTVYCPDFSQWPYEVWIVPKQTNVTFGQIDDSQLSDLGEILRLTLGRLEKIYKERSAGNSQNDPFSYNYYIYHGENWYLRIIPRLIHRAGFELGTGLSVNVVDPARAAEELAV